MKNIQGEPLKKTDRIWDKEFDNSPGVNRLFSWQWYLVASCFYGAFCLMAFDPWFGRSQFHYGFSLISMLIAYVLLVTLFFDMKLFGRNQGANLFLQISFFFPLMLFVARILGRPGPDVEQRFSVLRVVRETLSQANLFVFGGEFPPRIIVEILTSPATAITMGLLFAGTAIPKSRALKGGIILMVILGALFGTVASETTPSLSWFLGVALMIFGLTWMRHDVVSVQDDFVMVSILRDIDDAAEYKASLKLCNNALKDGPLTLNTALDIVAEIYQGYTPAEVGYIAETLCTRLIERYKLLELIHAEDKKLVPGRAFDSQPGLFEVAALLPRDIVIIVIAIVWIVSPLDLIPDAIPFIGLLDDMCIAYLGTCSLRNAFRTLKPNRANRKPA
jgi:hypothetical protein